MKLNFRKLKLALSRKKWLMTWLTVSLIVVFVMSICLYWIAKKSEQERTAYMNQLDLLLLQNQLDSALNSLNMVAVNMSANERLANIISKSGTIDRSSALQQIREIVQAYKNHTPIPFEVTVLSRENEIAYTQSGKSYAYFNDIIKREKPRNDQFLLTSPSPYSDRNELLLFRSLPLGSFYLDGVLVLHIDLANIKQYIDTWKFAPQQSVWLLDHKGRTVVGTMDETKDPLLQPGSVLYPFWHEPGQKSTVQFEDQTYLVDSALLPSTDYTIVILSPLHGSFVFSNSHWLYVAAISIGSALLLMALAYGYSYLLRKPINQLIRKYSMSDTMRGDEYFVLDRFIAQLVSDHHELQNQLDGFIPDLKLSTFQHLLWGELSEKDLVEKVQRLKLPLTGDLFYICVVSIDDYTHFLERFPGKEDQVRIHHQLRRMGMDIFGEMVDCVSFTPRHGLIVLMIGVDRTIEQRDKLIAELSEQLRKNVQEQYPFTVSIAISRGRPGYSSMSTSYQEASSLLHYKMILGNNITVSDAEIGSTFKKPTKDISAKQKQIVRLVVQGDLDGAAEQLDELCVAIMQHSYKSESMLGIFSYLLGELEYLLHEMDINIHELFPEDIYATLYNMSTSTGVKDWLCKTVFPKIKESLESDSDTKNKHVVQKVIYYIHDNYDADLTLQHVADQFSLSTYQLSRMFKEATNQNFSDYLISYRMKKAMELLENTDISIKEIAEKMRYTNVQNFSRIFKQIAGLPPGEYRKQSRES
jgi:AraC-like DNA-binding protein